MQDTDDDTTQDVDWVVGACFMLRRQVYEQLGGLDERFFMYSEELEYAWRMRRAGWRIVYFPTAQVVHYEGRSSEQIAAQRLILFHTSKVQLFEILFGRRRAQWLRRFLLVMFGVQYCEEALKYLLGHRRALRRERMVAYRQVLASGLRPAASHVPPSKG